MPVQRVSQGFKDISMTFQSNPLNGDLIALKDRTAIARSVRNIVMTVPGEKFFQPNFGSYVSASLFEQLNDFTSDAVIDEIKRSLSNHEPRIKVIKVDAFPQYDNNSLDVIIVYEIIGADVPQQQLQFALQSAS